MRCHDIISAALLLSVTLAVHAQTSQRGIVLEYNGREQKTPLGQVSIRVQNAGSTYSGEDGRFTLSFRTLKVGDKVVVRRIEKTDYELFNTDAIDQWNISRNKDEDFVIVMCRTEQLRQLRDQYLQAASENYKQQQKKESDQLEALRSEGKLQKSEYEKRLKQLQNEYEEWLEHIDSYIDRFARIDLSQLSKQEARIIEMVQQGNIEEAIEAYEEMELERQYEQTAHTRQQTARAIDSLTIYKTRHEAYRDSLKQAIKRRDKLRLKHRD